MREKRDDLVYVTAVEIAKEAGVDQKAYRAELRRAQLPWHGHQERWSVARGSVEHQDMLRVLSGLRSRG